MEDEAFVARLRAGEDRAYRELVRRHHTRLVRLAQTFCGIRASAEEVVQDSWVAVFTGIESFSGASPLKAWIAGIVVNKARTRGLRDGRMRSFSDFVRDEGGEEITTLDESRFSAGGGWAEPPLPWDGMTPERDIAGREVLSLLGDALDKLPPAQRAAVMLRDVEGQEPQEVCRLLEISEGNLRVLLHRARAKLRASLDAALATRDAAAGAS